MYCINVCTQPFKSLGSVVFFFKEINTFNQQRCIELVKGDSNEIYNVINILKSDVLLNFLSIKES